MIKLIIFTLIAATGAFVGISAADVLRKRRNTARRLHSLLTELAVMIRYRGLDLFDIVQRLRNNTEFSSLGFICSMPSEYSPELDFHDEWKRSVETDSLLTSDMKQILNELGSSLGTSDVDGQISVIDAALEKMTVLEKQLEAEYADKSRLYRSTGILLGIMTGIIFI